MRVMPGGRQVRQGDRDRREPLPSQDRQHALAGALGTGQPCREHDGQAIGEELIRAIILSTPARAMDLCLCCDKWAGHDLQERGGSEDRGRPQLTTVGPSTLRDHGRSDRSCLRQYFGTDGLHVASLSVRSGRRPWAPDENPERRRPGLERHLMPFEQGRRRFGQGGHRESRLIQQSAGDTCLSC